MKKRSLLYILLAVLIVLPRIGATQQSKQPKIPPDLWQKAQEKGVVRVIIDLDLPVQPESKLTEEGRNNQRHAIHTAQEQLLMELSSTKHEETGRLAIVPVIGLKVGLDALEILETSTLVKKVTEDKLLKSDLEIREQK